MISRKAIEKFNGIFIDGAEQVARSTRTVVNIGLSDESDIEKERELAMRASADKWDGTKCPIAERVPVTSPLFERSYYRVLKERRIVRMS